MGSVQLKCQNLTRCLQLDYYLVQPKTQYTGWFYSRLVAGHCIVSQVIKFGWMVRAFIGTIEQIGCDQTVVSFHVHYDSNQNEFDAISHA